MERVKSIRTIPATVNLYSASPITETQKRRVAAYARVSTDSEEQLTSYEAQVDYYTNYIKGRSDWEFVSVFTDSGISATNTRHREGFKKMIAEALAGHIDLIITKSVSRFARNTVDSLSTIRQLKDKGVECYFEKENIWTFDGKGELLLTIMSSLAQEESRSISENVKWGHRKRFADGKVSFAYSRVLGLDKGENGQIVVNKEEAETVKLIFRLFLEGMTPYSIARELTKRGIKSPGGKDEWNKQTVRNMLSNEKYKGDALLQKGFTVDYLQKKTKKNEGEVPQYYVEGNHEAIISPKVFDMVQAELEKRKHGKGTRYSGVSIFSNKIKCGDCGNWYGSKVWHSTDKYRKVIYRCNHKFDGDKKCDAPHITEDEVKLLFVKAFNQLMKNKDEIIKNVELMRIALCDDAELKKEQNRLYEELTTLNEMLQTSIKQNAHKAQNQDSYRKRYGELAKKYEMAKEQYDEVAYRLEQKTAQSERIQRFADTLRSRAELLTEFDASLWSGLVEYVTIGKMERSVTFKDGTEIKVD